MFYYNFKQRLISEMIKPTTVYIYSAKLSGSS